MEKSHRTIFVIFYLRNANFPYQRGAGGLEEKNLNTKRWKRRTLILNQVSGTFWWLDWFPSPNLQRMIPVKVISITILWYFWMLLRSFSFYLMPATDNLLHAITNTYDWAALAFQKKWKLSCLRLANRRKSHKQAIAASFFFAFFNNANLPHSSS